MFARWGTDTNYYQWPDNELCFSAIRARRLYSKRHKLIFTQYTLECRGIIVVPNTITDKDECQDHIKSRIDELYQILNTEGDKNIELFHDDGERSAHYLTYPLSINGVSVRTFDFPKGEREEYATQREYRIVFQSEYPNVEDQIVWYYDELRYVGSAGSLWEMVLYPAGDPSYQIIYQKTTQRVIQQGNAIGYDGYVIEPPPAFPDWEHGEQRVYTAGTPTVYRKGFIFMPSSWRYVMELPAAQSPILPPVAR